MKRVAHAKWIGSLRNGSGSVSTGSGLIENLAYTFSTRFEDTPGTNPEELVAAAHAGCFSMALSAELGRGGFTPETIETTAAMDFRKTDAGWTAISIHLDTRAKVPKVDDAAFQKAAETAKKGCPISRLLKTEITLSAKLV